MMIDENLIFVSLVTVFIIFIIHKQPFLIGTICVIALFYYLYKGRFTNPRDFISYITNKTKEAFEPCSSSNMSYCGSDARNSNITFLPDIMRSGPINNNINKKTKLNTNDYQIDKRLKNGITEISLEEIISAVPPLLDYKLYLEKVIKFVVDIKTDDSIQKDFLAKKLQKNMSNIFYNAYNTVSDNKYPIHIYNKLLHSEREFNDTMNIFVFLGMNEYDTYNFSELQKESKKINDKLNQFVIEKVNDISPNDYNITTSFLPRKDEPEGIDINDNYINL